MKKERRKYQRALCFKIIGKCIYVIDYEGAAEAINNYDENQLRGCTVDAI
jgi:hypothetical protein